MICSNFNNFFCVCIWIFTWSWRKFQINIFFSYCAENNSDFFYYNNSKTYHFRCFNFICSLTWCLLVWTRCPVKWINIHEFCWETHLSCNKEYSELIHLCYIYINFCLINFSNFKWYFSIDISYWHFWLVSKLFSWRFYFIYIRHSLKIIQINLMFYEIIYTWLFCKA